MKNKHWCDIVTKMLTVIPAHYAELSVECQNMLVKLPEENNPRDLIFITLTKHVPHPCVEWQYQVWSWYSAKNINEIIIQFRQPN